MFLLGVVVGGVIVGIVGMLIGRRHEEIRQKRANHARRLRTPKRTPRYKE